MGIGSIRRSQLIYTYGVGAIINLPDMSVMVMSTDHWEKEAGRLPGTEIVEARLSSEGRSLRRPPVESDGSLRDAIPVIRFPYWYYCPNPKCRRLGKFSAINDNGSCGYCSEAKPVPSRFVAVCEGGHIEDFPFIEWVHGGQHCPSPNPVLRLLTVPGSESLAGLSVKCDSCNLTRSLKEAFESHGLVKTRSCGGRRPWLGQDGNEQCGKPLRTMQRGASNIWFPYVKSVISIPPWSESIGRLTTDPAVRELIDNMRQADGNLRKQIAQMIINICQSKGEDVALDELEAWVDEDSVPRSSTEDEIRGQEFRALSLGRSDGAGREFVASRHIPSSALSELIEQTTEVSRLREVRALIGFSRLNPGGTVNPVGLNTTWLPADVVFGEGIFVKFNKARVEEWSSQPEIRERARRIAPTLEGPARQYPSIIARTDRVAGYLLTHILAHSLIGELSLIGGYPAASLRERLYAGEDGYGLLVYTGAADSAGSLGGLSRMAVTGEFELVLRQAVNRYAWCSSDPVCIESDPDLPHPENLAACHSCAFLPETSCEVQNQFLDRYLLVGEPGNRSVGYFGEIVEA